MNLHFAVAALAATIAGMSKGGLKGLGLLVVTLMAVVYGARISTGIIVPLFIIGDILAVLYFKKHVKWKYLKQFMPTMLLGVVVAAYVGESWDEAVFKKWMSVIILGSVLYMFWTEYKSVVFKPDSKIIAASVGFAAGFTTMIGNLAGPFANLYFLATRLPKKEIVGTAAWVFFIINIFKVPFHVFAWGTISKESLMVDLKLFPFVIIGFFIGTRLLGLFSERNYRKFLLIVTALGALIILYR